MEKSFRGGHTALGAAAPRHWAWVLVLQAEGGLCPCSAAASGAEWGLDLKE